MSIELTERLLTSEAEDAAKNNMMKDKKTTASQMRRFYDDFMLLHSKSKLVDEEAFKKEILPLVCFSKAKMAYCVGKGVLTKEFKGLIEAKVNQIQTRKDFDNFMLFYQAVIGYSKYYENEKPAGLQDPRPQGSYQGYSHGSRENAYSSKGNSGYRNS